MPASPSQIAGSATLAGLAVILGIQFGPASGRETPPHAVPAHPAMVGSSSCSTSGCHGGGGRPGTRGSEWNTWIDRDPHSQAHRVLFNAKSVRMAKNLDLRYPTGNLIPAHENKTCLKCHGPADNPELHADGASCESCHGPAGRYETVHYQEALWKKLLPKEKSDRYGLVETKNLTTRVAACASCHIGDADRDVDHDLIAAGHPRLMFEYSSLHHNRNYTPHWLENDSAFEVRSWVIGQVAGARASLALLKSRAVSTDPERRKHWPELSEFNCYSCHQGIGNGPGEAGIAKVPGVLPWSDWPYAMLPVLAANAGKAESDRVLEPLKKLRELMADRPTERSEIAAAADRCIVELDRWLAAMEESKAVASPDQLRALIRSVACSAAGQGQTAGPADWDRQAQHFLGASQLAYALRERTGAPLPKNLKDELESLRRDLFFREKTNTPRRDRTNSYPDHWIRILNDPWTAPAP